MIDGCMRAMDGDLLVRPTVSGRLVTRFLIPADPFVLSPLDMPLAAPLVILRKFGSLATTTTITTNAPGIMAP